MEDLEGQAATMAWDCDANDIDVDKDNWKQCVQVTPQTMRHLKTQGPSKIGLPMPPMTLLRQMWVYALQPSWDGQAEQASTPNMIPVHIPQIRRDLVIKENLGKGTKWGENETTADEDGESELTELSTTPKARKSSWW